MSRCNQRSGVSSTGYRLMMCGLFCLLTLAATAQNSKKKPTKPAPKSATTRHAPPAHKPASPKKGGIRSRTAPIFHHSYIPHSSSRYGTPSRANYSPPVAPVESFEPRGGTTERIQASLTDPAISIEGAKNLAPFFASLKALETSPQSSEVRILHFGDSHTAADLFTHTLRTDFQARFGDGGAGFTVAGYPFKGYRIYGTRHGMSTGWSVLGTNFRDLGDAMVGMGGISLLTERRGDWVSLDATASTLRVQYLLQRDGGDIAIYDGDTLLQRISTAADNSGAAVYTTNVTPGEHHFEVRTLMDAPVRLFGFVTENAGGVTYEAMGINGAEAALFLRWNQIIQQELVQDQPPSLIVLDYGTNEASDHTWTEEGYEAMFEKIILRCRQMAPGVPILVIGPPDRAIRAGRHGWAEFAGVDRIIAAQRAVCRQMGCAFWDWRKRMGGFGAMRDWTAVGLAQPDHTHFTVEGYTELATAFFSDIVRQYEVYSATSDTGTGSIQ